jgi:hypothetical protein
VGIGAVGAAAKKLVNSECGCGGGPHRPVAPNVPVMTAAGTSKVEARKRAREATRRANEARAARDKANIEDAANYLVAVGRIAEVEAWKKERLAQLREQVDAEAGKRVAVQRAEAGAAIVRMQDRGETLAAIAARTEAGIGEVRAMLRYAPKGDEKPTARNGSHALGGGDGVADPTVSPADGAADDPEAASA